MFRVRPNLDAIVEKYCSNIKKYVANEIKRKQTFALMKKEAQAKQQKKLEKAQRPRL